MTDMTVALNAAGAVSSGWTMNPALRIALGIGIVIFYAILFVLLKRRTLVLRYSLLWMLSGLALVVFLLFPQIVVGFAALIGVSNPVNAVFLMFAGFALLLILSLTAIVSQLSTQNRKLIQAVALLDKRVATLEEQLGRDKTE